MIQSPVEVEIKLRESGALRRDFGKSLLITNELGLPYGTLTKEYNDINEVGVDFNTNTNTYKHAKGYFAQYNVNTLVVGYQNEQDLPAGIESNSDLVTTELSVWNTISNGSFKFDNVDYTNLDFRLFPATQGKFETSDISSNDFTAVTDGAFVLVIDGVNIIINNLNFTTATTLTQVKDVIATGLPTGVTVEEDGVKITFTSDKLGITSAIDITAHTTGTDITTASFLDIANGVKTAGTDLSGATSLGEVANIIQNAMGSNYSVVYNHNKFLITKTVGTFVGFVTEVGSGTFIGSQLAMRQEDAPSVANNIIPAISLIDLITTTGDFYAISLIDYYKDDSTKLIDFIDWIELSKYLLILDTEDLTFVIANYLKSKNLTRTMQIFDKANQGLATFLTGYIAGNANLDTQQAIQFAYKDLNTATADTYTSNELIELDNRNIQYFAELRGKKRIMSRTEFNQSGFYLDTRVGFDWLQDRIEARLLDLLNNTPKIPQNTYGESLVYGALDEELQVANQSTFITTGVVSIDFRALIRTITGNSEFDGTLKNGYLIYITPFVEQAQVDRDQRIFPQTYVFLKLAGAILNIKINIIVEN